MIEKEVENEKIKNSKILVVGAGGIGCEILNTLAQSGFSNIEAIDKDTIELTNLNRQFLFTKQDIGKSKVETARDKIINWYPTIEHFVAHHNDITSNKFNVKFYQQFNVVLNALDNIYARRWVNRNCLAANVPLVDSGSAGYLGQVHVHIKGLTECYDCVPHPPPTVHPVCSIRTNPSELIHCVIWAKNILEQLFGENIEDQQDIGLRKFIGKDNKLLEELVHKIFVSDIKKIQSMDSLWKSQIAPSILTPEIIKSNLIGDVDFSTMSSSENVWSLERCVNIFKACISTLIDRSCGCSVTFDKDDDVVACLVASASNIRADLFHIPKDSFFKIMSLAGNIIPAIASTNDIIASLAVYEAVKLIRGYSNINDVFLVFKPVNDKIITSASPALPNPECYVCAFKPTVHVKCNPNKVTLEKFRKEIIVKEFGMERFDVYHLSQNGSLLLSCDETETIDNLSKNLTHFHVQNGSQLKVEDFESDQYFVVIIVEETEFDEDSIEILTTTIEHKNKQTIPDSNEVFDELDIEIENESHNSDVEVIEEQVEVKKRKINNLAEDHYDDPLNKSAKLY